MPIWFKKFTGGKSELEIEVEAGTTAVQAAVLAGIPEDEIGFVAAGTCKVDKEYILSDGERVKVYQQIIGG